MPFLRAPKQKPITLQLRRDLVRNIKRGHCWIYADALRSLPRAYPGVSAILLDNRGGREIGRGFYDSQGSIAMRVCITNRGEELTDSWASRQILRAVSLRNKLFGDDTNAYRLINGEGDNLPGLVCDRYADAAVLRFDGKASTNFYHAKGIAAWMAEDLGLNMVYERNRDQGKSLGRVLFGPEPASPIQFLENGIKFAADIVHGHKTGFFLDQRDNRQRMQEFVAGKKVLDVFGYTGGFSSYAGIGGATHVTTVDVSQPALNTAKHNWSLNGLSEDQHDVIRADAFEYLKNQKEKGKLWDVVIIDPPSFAPSKEALPAALNAYKKLIASGASITTTDGILALSSCSSHVSQKDFLLVCQEGISIARKQATVLGVHSLPADHPVPLAMPEIRYLKFIILRVND